MTSLVKVPPMIQNICKNISSLIENRLLLHIYYQYICSRILNIAYFSYLSFFYFSGVYLPLLWEPSFCSKSPIALGYTRGHFCALVPPEPVSQPHIRNYSTNVTTGASGSLSVSTTGASSASYLEASTIEDEAKATYLPLMTSDRKQLLPIHFLSQTEAGNEEVILQQWLDVCATGKKKFLVKQY